MGLDVDPESIVTQRNENDLSTDYADDTDFFEKNTCTTRNASKRESV